MKPLPIILTTVALLAVIPRAEAGCTRCAVAAVVGTIAAIASQQHRCLVGDPYCQVLPPQGYPLPPLGAPRDAPPPVARPQAQPPQLSMDEDRERIIRDGEIHC
jgi:hypothetical protein